MTLKERLELITLTNVLNDTLICRRLKSSLLDELLKRYSELLDKFLETYELPEDSVNSSLKN